MASGTKTRSKHSTETHRNTRYFLHNIGNSKAALTVATEAEKVLKNEENNSLDRVLFEDFTEFCVSEVLQKETSENIMIITSDCDDSFIKKPVSLLKIVNCRSHDCYQFILLNDFLTWSHRNFSFIDISFEKKNRNKK